MTQAELKEFLDEKAAFYENPSFLEDDPLQIPHRFSNKEDIEISAFLTATIAWGNRKSIITNASRLMELMDYSPHDFVMNYEQKDIESLSSFVHRTFNGEDLQYFVHSLNNIYSNHGGLESIFSEYQESNSLQFAISKLKEVFFQPEHPKRTEKHVSDPNKGSAAKRINMFLRWMVRDNTAGVDFGLWKSLNPSQLSCPLDVHSGNVARKLKLELIS